MFTGCTNGGKKDAKIYSAGEKADIDHVTYDVIDMQTLPKLEDNGEARIPKERFYLTQISVFNGGNVDFSVPTLVLLDDQGNAYPELADGRGVTDWVGVSRKLSPGETLLGNVVFDAPVKHYKLRISDEYSDQPVFVDMPLSFVHEGGGLVPPVPAADPSAVLAPLTKDGTKK